MTDEIRPLTAEEKEMLGLSPERVEGLALADGAERRSEVASIITRFTNALKDKARLIEREDERRVAFDKITGKVKGARKYINEQIKGKKAKKLQVADTNMQEAVKPFLRLNIYI